MEFNTKVYTNNPKHFIQILIRFIAFTIVGFTYSIYSEHYEPFETIWEIVVNYLLIALIIIVWLWFGFYLYKIKNEKNNTSISNKNKRLLILLGIIFGIAIVGIGYLFLNGENVSIGTSKSVEVDGDVKLSIYSVKGAYHIESFEFEDTIEDILDIPYYAAVEQGEIVLIVEGSDGIVWDESISGSKTGKIELPVKKGDYDIWFYTDKAKKVKLNIELY